MKHVLLEDILFNSEISKWDVSRVKNMDGMFSGTASFKQKLCGPARLRSKASKIDMFADSSGSISLTVCKVTTSFSSQTELKSAVDAGLSAAHV